jgi:hypothetical protein
MAGRTRESGLAFLLEGLSRLCVHGARCIFLPANSWYLLHEGYFHVRGDNE